MLVYGNLIAEIAKRGYTKNEIANCLGISRNTLTNKLVCKTVFSKDEFDLLLKNFFPDLNSDYLSEKYRRPEKKNTA